VGAKSRVSFGNAVNTNDGWDNDIINCRRQNRIPLLINQLDGRANEVKHIILPALSHYLTILFPLACYLEMLE
jgi:hypothetical protein